MSTLPDETLEENCIEKDLPTRQLDRNCINAVFSGLHSSVSALNLLYP